MPEDATGATAGSRREELLAIAAGLFAERGVKNTTVRDIADAAGILSGSLYHHFDSKDSMVDEILSSFQDGLFMSFDEVMAADVDARTKVERIIRLSFDAIDQHHSEVAIYQNESGYLLGFERFGYLADRNEQLREVWMALLEAGRAEGALRADLDAELVYRFIRDTVWVAVKWYRPGGGMAAAEVADQYLAILLDGIAS